MARIRFVTLERAAQVEPPAGGLIQSRAYFNKPTDPLQLCMDRMKAGATLNVTPVATDTLVYVWTGVVSVRGVRLAERSSLIIERAAATQITALEAEPSLLFFSLKGQSRSERSERSDRLGPRVRLLPRERVPCNWDLQGQGSVGGALHADASDPCCQLWLHENDFYIANFPVAVHSHSEDEIIFVRKGELRVAKRRYGPGTALAIAANAKYGFDVGPTGLSFVNFRAASPTYTAHDAKESMDEGEFWRSQTGRPEYVELPAG